jgi:hypothetical protein
MSLNIKYYAEAGTTKTDYDLGRSNMSQQDCNKFYFSPSPMGWYNDLGALPIGNRPVHARYKVGDCTKMTPSNYVQPGEWGCRQPSWRPQSK